MMRKILFLFLLMVVGPSWATEETMLALDKAPIDSHNMRSIQRGAKFFATNCMVCHTLIYLRYNKVAQEAGITYDKMPINVKTWPLDVKPPDLSLIADVRGVDWIYTYLHSFYIDPSRPTGFNNLLVPNTAMAGVLSAYQGKQIKASDTKVSQGDFDHFYQWYDILELQSQGSMSPQQFDATMTDLVNFLGYAAAPYQREQNNLGYGVLAFLLILLVLVYLLRKEYWKDVK